MTRKKDPTRATPKPPRQVRPRGRIVKYVPVEAASRAFDGTLSELVPNVPNVDDYVGDALLGIVLKY